MGSTEPTTIVTECYSADDSKESVVVPVLLRELPVTVATEVRFFPSQMMAIEYCGQFSEQVNDPLRIFAEEVNPSGGRRYVRPCLAAGSLFCYSCHLLFQVCGSIHTDFLVVL